ncbi:MAG: hypothetical protein LKM39_15870 [Chiayiivirga sp.]|nr:hypothetical protein [Chiayiivirga sp.]
MHAQADTQRAELRLAFLRHLPKRAEALGRRGRRLCRDGWDINGLSLLHDDVQRLAGVSGRYGVLEVSEQLLALEDLLGQFLSSESLPRRRGQRSHRTDAGRTGPQSSGGAGRG